MVVGLRSDPADRRTVERHRDGVSGHVGERLGALVVPACVALVGHVRPGPNVLKRWVRVVVGVTDGGDRRGVEVERDVRGVVRRRG